MKEALVTGGGGFIGSQLCKHLLKDGYRVKCFDNLDSKVVNPKTIDELNELPNFQLIKGDILSLSSLKRAMGSSNVIIHCAAISSVDRSIKNPLEAVHINSLGTLNILEAARKSGVKRVHYVSTDEIYGHANKASFSEDSSINPRNPYAAGKLGGEAIVLAWGATYGLEVTITNSVNNYGAYQSPDKLIPRLVARALLGKTLPVYGDGKQIREWISVDDHIQAILYVIEHGVYGERYLVGTGERRANIEVVKRILKLLHLNEELIDYVEDRKGHDIRYAVDSTKLRGLGWEPTVLFEDGIKQTVEWYVENRQWWEYYVSVYPDLV